MDKITYEALKRIINFCQNKETRVHPEKEIIQVKNWVNEVAKDYEEDKTCPHSFTEVGKAEICPTCHEVIDFQVED